MQVRRARREDAPTVHALLLAAFTPFQAAYTPACFDATVLDAPRVQARMDEGPVWLAVHGTPVGTLGARLDGRGAYLRGLAVHPGAQGQGAGRRLLETAEDWARDAGAACLWLSTTPFLTASRRLYGRFGFLPADGPEELLGTPLIGYEKRL